MTTNAQRLFFGLLIIFGGTLFCHHYARPEYQGAITFIWAAASGLATVVQWIINGAEVG